MNLILSRIVNGVSVDGYYGDKLAWFTREQIGSALEYSNPRLSIANIHNRHKDRFVGKSGVIKLITPDGKFNDTWLYNFKGVLEICRWSKQPKADMVMDALYDMAEEVSRRGYLSTIPDSEVVRLYKERKAANPALLVDVHAENLRQKRENRVQRQEESDLLYSQKETLTLNEYIPKLRAIWREDMVGFHKAYDLYMNWWKRDGCRQEAYDDV